MERREVWRRWFKIARLCLMALAVRYLPVRDWSLNLFTLAERLWESGELAGDDWRTVQQAVVWTLQERDNWETNTINEGQAALALKSIRNLHAVTERLLVAS